MLVHLASIVDPIADDAFDDAGQRRGHPSRARRGGRRRRAQDRPALDDRGLRRLGRRTRSRSPRTRRCGRTRASAPAVQGAEVERLLAEWQHDHPARSPRRCAPRRCSVRGAQHLWARLLTGPSRVRVRGAAPPVQVVHVDDVADALAARRRARTSPACSTSRPTAGSTRRRSTRCVRRPARRAFRPTCCARALGGCGRAASATCPPRRRAVPRVPVGASRPTGCRRSGWAPQHTNEETILETVDARPHVARSRRANGRDRGRASPARRGIATAASCRWRNRRRRRSARRALGRRRRRARCSVAPLVPLGAVVAEPDLLVLLDRPEQRRTRRRRSRSGSRRSSPRSPCRCGRGPS